MFSEARTEPPPWIPSGAGSQMVAVGEHGWDAVSVPHPHGLRILVHLGQESGAVIEETPAARDLPSPSWRMTWLVEHGAADAWDLPEKLGVTVLGTACRIHVPGLRAVGYLRWRVSPGGPGPLLTDAVLLRAVVLLTQSPLPVELR